MSGEAREGQDERRVLKRDLFGSVAVLRGPDYGEFLTVMYGNDPDRWDPDLTGIERLPIRPRVATAPVIDRP